MQVDWISRLSLSQKAELLCGKNFWDSRGIPGYDIPSVCFSDGPHGLRKQDGNADNLGIFLSQKATCFPTASALACSWDEDLARRIGQALSREAQSFDVDVLLGPGINVMRHPFGGRNFEYFSEDPWLTGRLANAQCEGTQSGVQACIKHFLLNSQEKRRMCMDETASETLIREIYGLPFEMIVKNHNSAWVMTAYNLVNGTYASENPFLYSLLRKDWGLDGAVISDWGGCHNLIRSVEAGQNLEMPSTFTQSARELVSAVESGRLSESVLDERISELVPVWNQILENREHRSTKPDLKEHARLAEEAAARSMVLLEDDDHLLPLKADSKILFVGPFEHHFPFQGDGSSRVNPTRKPVLEKAAERAGLKDWKVVRGYGLKPDARENPDLLKEALYHAGQADVIVFLLSLDPAQSIEGADKTSGSFPAHQHRVLQTLAKTGRPVIVVDAASGAMELPVLKRKHAIIYSGLAGQGSLDALLSLLLGRRPFSGHLAITFPWTISAKMKYGYFPSSGPQAIYAEEAFTGYRKYWREPQRVRYAFGHGITPARLRIRKARLAEEGVYFTACNQSEEAGRVVVQMYREWQNPGKNRAPGELRGFLMLDLEGQEERECFIPFDEYTFRFWNEQKGEWQISRKDVSILLGETPFKIQARLSLKGHEEDPDLCDVPGSMPAEIRSYSFNEDMPLELADESSSILVRHLIRRLQIRRADGFRKGRPDLISMAILDMPLRSLSKNSGNLVSSEMARAASDFIGDPSTRHLYDFFRLLISHWTTTARYRKEHLS